MFEEILDGNIRSMVENTLDEAYNGFRRVRSMRDDIFTLKQIMQSKGKYT